MQDIQLPWVDGVEFKFLDGFNQHYCIGDNGDIYSNFTGSGGYSHWRKLKSWVSGKAMTMKLRKNNKYVAVNAQILLLKHFDSIRESARKIPQFPKIDGVEFKQIQNYENYLIGSNLSFYSCKLRGNSMGRKGKWKPLKIQNYKNSKIVYLTNNGKTRNYNIYTLFKKHFPNLKLNREQKEYIFPDIPNIEFRRIQGYENYIVGSNGDIYKCTNNKGFSCPWTKLKFYKDLNGYLTVKLSKIGQKIKMFFVHFLVLQAFIGPRPQGMQCRHKDGTRNNCNYTNLEYGTPSENARDKNRHGTMLRGNKHHASKLSEEQVRIIKIRLKTGERQCDLAREYNVNSRIINNIYKNRFWKWIV